MSSDYITNGSRYFPTPRTALECRAAGFYIPRHAAAATASVTLVSDWSDGSGEKEDALGPRVEGQPHGQAVALGSASRERPTENVLLATSAPIPGSHWMGLPCRMVFAHWRVILFAEELLEGFVSSAESGLRSSVLWRLLL